MMTVYCDESGDDKTYALAGWIAVPHGIGLFDPAWRAMLQTIAMPDGSPCPSFHTSAITNRDHAKKSPFKGWARADEIAAFTKAVDAICDKTTCAVLWPVGCAVELPSDYQWIPRDSVWTLMYVKLYEILYKVFPAQRGIDLVFDNKPEVVQTARKYHAAAKEVFDRLVPGYMEGIDFQADEDVPLLQAADLLVYEWRKRITARQSDPGAPMRTSFRRIREARPDGALWRYDLSVHDASRRFESATQVYLDSLLVQKPSHRD